MPIINPGPARGWICRKILGYDRWIPSVLMMTHYLEVQNDLRSISLMVRWTFNTISNPFKRRNGNDTPLQRTQETIN